MGCWLLATLTRVASDAGVAVGLDQLVVTRRVRLIDAKAVQRPTRLLLLGRQALPIDPAEPVAGPVGVASALRNTHPLADRSAVGSLLAGGQPPPPVRRVLALAVLAVPHAQIGVPGNSTCKCARERRQRGGRSQSQEKCRDALFFSTRVGQLGENRVS